MKITEFISNNIITQDELEGLVISTYIPVQRKIDLAKAILSKCVIYEDGFVTIDEVHKKIYTVVAVLSEYTGLEFSSNYNEMVMEYDLLCEKGYYGILPRCLAADIAEFRKVIEAEKNIILAKNSIEAQVAKVAENLMNTINTLVGNFEDKIGDLIPEGTDLTSLINFLENMN